MSAQPDPRPIVSRIWREIGYSPATPRDLVQPIMETFDVAVVLLPRLSVSAINDWLLVHGRTPINYQDRPLGGCLLARRGVGLIFVNGALDPPERQFAIAHEFAHFFAHYLEPRRRAISRFGDNILPALDGDRLPTTAERVSEIVQNVPLGGFDDLFERSECGLPSTEVVGIETQADMIAMELLAPIDRVLVKTGAKQDMISVLVNEFGLPAWAAQEWTGFIRGLKPRSDPVILSIERAIKKNS